MTEGYNPVEQVVDTLSCLIAYDKSGMTECVSREKVQGGLRAKLILRALVAVISATEPISARHH